MLHFNGSKIPKIQKVHISVSILEKNIFSICAHGSLAIAPWPPGGPWPPVWEPLLYRMSMARADYRVVQKKLTLFKNLYFPEKLIFSFHFLASRRVQLQVSSDTKMETEKQFSVEERTKILELYFATKSVVLVQGQFLPEFPGWTNNPGPLYSPDLHPPDYFLWGYLKERVYQDNPDTIERLKENIRREIRRIPRDMLERVMNNFNVRVAAVIRQRGAWIEHVINY